MPAVCPVSGISGSCRKCKYSLFGECHATYYVTYCRKTIIAEVQRVQETPIENEYGEMRLPKAIRVIFYAPNEKGIDLIVDLFEYDVARAWVAKGKKPAAHLRHAINNRLEHAKFTVEPVQYTSESEYTD